MLESLKINNFVLIPTINLDFYDGMTVLTGETGSGKSIVLGAISLILGSKADKDEIRAGESKAELEAVFRTERKSLIALLDEKGIDSDDGRIIIRRQIRSNGRSFYSLNGVNLTIAEAQEIGRMLVDITERLSDDACITESMVNLMNAIGSDELSRAAIMDRMALSDKTSFRKLYLGPAVSAGIAAMTCPEKPNHPQQRYYLTKKGRNLLRKYRRAGN